MHRLTVPLLLLLAACSGAAPTTLQDPAAPQDDPAGDGDAAVRPDVTELPAIDADASSDESSDDDAAPDGGLCADYVAPDTAATCHACNGSSNACQPNGCFGGYYCDTVTTHCVALPDGC